MKKPKIDYYAKLNKEVIEAGICTHCGTCIGLFPHKLIQQETERGPLPIKKNKKILSDEIIYCSCPAREIEYRKLNRFVFQKGVKDFTLGNYQQGFVGFAVNKNVRQKGASGGIVTATLLYLLKERLINGAVVVKQGVPKPWLAKPIIATSAKEILSCAQSVYIPVMTNVILAQIKKFSGNLAYVGLPDQVAAIRKLQMLGHNDALKIKYIIGLYMGTGIYLEAIRSYLRSNKVKTIKDITYLRYRDGNWPGYLHIKTKKGQSLMAPKFYYNYLTPFYITTASLTSVDFSNELTDISVGDAWSPKYEGRQGGFSVILARTNKGLKILKTMKKKKLIFLEKKEHLELINMHGHMLDFKKRGAFIRLSLMKIFGKKIPHYDYRPEKIGPGRFLVELVIIVIFFIGRRKLARQLVEKMPIPLIGRIFDFLRNAWKKLSKSTKRQGILNLKFKTNP